MNQKKLLLIPMLAFSLFFLKTDPLKAQTTKEFLILSIEKYKREIASLKKKQKEEEQFYKRFLNEKKILIKQKKKEKITITREINRLQNNIQKNKNETQSVQIFIKRNEDQQQIYKKELMQYLKELKQMISEGFPFEIERRLAFLDSIYYDLETEKATIPEAFNRILKFFETEEILAYDSQVTQNIETINKKRISSTLFRIGRVYLAVDTGNAIYLYQKNEKGYFIDAQNPLTGLEKRNIRQSILMIQGKTPPGIVRLPINANQINKPSNKKR